MSWKIENQMVRRTERMERRFEQLVRRALHRYSLAQDFVEFENPSFNLPSGGRIVATPTRIKRQARRRSRHVVREIMES